MASITVDPTNVIGEINPYLFGSFVEHLPGCVYGGIYDPDSPLADDAGFRQDVLDAVRRLAPTQLRYPGGNFVSGYHWRDGIGPRSARPVRFDHAWRRTETNAVGTHEFVEYCRRVSAVPHFCVNLGNGTPEEAADWVEYCNGRYDTSLTRLRAANGSPEPFAIPLWGLGNEIYGRWEIGQKSAATYADLALEAARRMREVDPTVKLVACGWEDSRAWNATVLERLAPEIDYLSLHLYIGNDDYLTALAQPLILEQVVRWTSALSRLVCRELGLTKQILISFDEWNVWFETQSYRDVYTLKDALAVAGCLNAFVRSADVVSLANQSLLVNAIAPILTNQQTLVRQTIYWPLHMFRRLAGCLSVRAGVVCESYRAEYEFRGWRIDEEVPYLDVSAAMGRDGRTMILCVVNRHPSEAIEAQLRIAGAVAAPERRAEVLSGPDHRAANTFENPDLVAVVQHTWTAEPSLTRYTFAPHALTMLTIPLA